MKVQRDGRRFTVEVTPDGEGLVSHAGAALLAEAADRLGLTDELSRSVGEMRRRRGRHDPGRVVRDLAVMLADGGDCLADLRAVRDQEPLIDSDGGRRGKSWAWAVHGAPFVLDIASPGSTARVLPLRARRAPNGRAS